VSVEQNFSLRDLFKYNDKLKGVMDMMTTSMLATLLPDFTAEYGDGKKVDVVLSPSHELFQEGIPGSKMTGVYMDRNGNWKVQVNLMAQLLVERMPGVWDPARSIYLTFLVKVKFMTDASNPFEKYFKIMPKNFEISQIKITKDEEEMTGEAVMVQSLINIQLE